MSNFICSECGMTNIDCGRDGYKTPKEIELEKKVHILNEANMKLENELGHFADLSKKVERLQEQLNEANEVIKTIKQITGNIDLSQFDYEHRRKIDGITMQTDSYLEKWGVK